MEKYTWNIKDIKNLKKKYVDEAYTHISDERSADIQSNIQTINSMILQYKLSSPILTSLYDATFKFNPRYTIEEFRTDKKDFSTPFQIDIAFTNNNLLKEYNDFLCDFKLIANKISFKHQMKLTKENYLDIFGNKKDIDFIFNPSNHRLHMCRNKQNNFTYNLDNLVYLMIYYSNTIKTYLSLNHECGHLYEHYLTDVSYIKNPRLYSYSEVSSIFLELISANKLLIEKIITNDEAKNIHLDILTTNLQIYDFMQALDINSKASQSLIDKLKMCTLSESVEQLHYHVSYIIALNLYYQYLQSPKDAVNNLKYILCNINENKEKEILKNAEIDLSGKCLEMHIEKQKRNN